MNIVENGSDYGIENDDGETLGRIVMDFSDEVKQVVISDPSARRKVLELAVSHIRLDVTHRTGNGLGGLKIKEHRAARERRSKEAMSFDAVTDEVRALSDDELTDVVRRRNYGEGIVEASYVDLSDVLNALVSNINAEFGVELSWSRGSKRGWSEEVPVVFEVKGDHTFTFWKALHVSDNPESSLHILPSYHPEAKGQSYRNLINGSTSVCIRGDSIYGVQPPRGSGKGGGFGSWETEHPFYARGQVLDVTMKENSSLKQEGYAHAKEFLVNALGLGTHYVGVSGGFRSPFTLPQNCFIGQELPEVEDHTPETIGYMHNVPLGVRMMHEEIIYRQDNGFLERPKKKMEIRGSEGDCVWEYETLEAEGELENAVVPPWLLREGWVERYKNPRFRDGVKGLKLPEEGDLSSSP